MKTVNEIRRETTQRPLGPDVWIQKLFPDVFDLDVFLMFLGYFWVGCWFGCCDGCFLCAMFCFLRVDILFFLC